MNTRVIMIAPARPPCYSSQALWLSYLEGVLAEHRQGHANAPLSGNPPAFNYDFNFCADCTAQHSFAMERAGRCDPEHLRKIDAQRDAA